MYQFKPLIVFYPPKMEGLRRSGQIFEPCIVIYAPKREGRD